MLAQPVQDQVEQVFRVGAGELAVAELAQQGVIESRIGQLQPVKSARSAVPAFRPARFSGPLPAPAVRLSTQRALRKSQGTLRVGFIP
jgi:hypothetical protein